MKKIHLFDSLREGYLRRGYEEEYIVILNDPFISTRCGLKNIFTFSPEIFIGHHRAGALVALGKYMVKVVIAKDNKPGSCQCGGKIHDTYLRCIRDTA